MDKKTKKKREPYRGFEQGPIRPPSEAHSLLIRITRNCPWNRCTFCPVYNDTRFSLRPVDHVKKDIDTVSKYVQILRKLVNESGRIQRADINMVAGDSDPEEMQALNAAFQWLSGGLSSIFLQDANSLVIKPSDLVEILLHLKKSFPWVERITSYARSHTIARIKDHEMKAISDAGLNRIHVGLESGSDQVLAMVNKGVDKKTHIKAGLKVKRAGMELSEYVMPGLGGRALSKVHALETADALNRIDPDFIRLRPLAVPPNVKLYEDYASGSFETCTEVMKAKELLLMLENLKGITSTIKSDHMLNLFEEINGSLPEDKERMISALELFLDLDPEKQAVFQVGKRLGIFSCLEDIKDPLKLARAEEACKEHGINSKNADKAIEDIIKRYI